MADRVLDIVYREETDRWIAGDRYVRPMIRKLFRSRARFLSGMQLVVRNFLLGLERRGVAYRFNRLPLPLPRSYPVISFGLGSKGLLGIHRSTPLIAAVGFPLPYELPTLDHDYNLRRYLQHSDWVLNLARDAGAYHPSVFGLWAAGIDTEEWTSQPAPKDVDVLIYDKLYFDRARLETELLGPVIRQLELNGLSFLHIRYGEYSPSSFKAALARVRSMIFLSPHETQGLAYQECLASDVPVFAWNPGWWTDPARFAYGLREVPATSIPFFDERCGRSFTDIDEFRSQFAEFRENVSDGRFAPREFVLDNLSIEKSTARMLRIYDSVAS